MHQLEIASDFFFLSSGCLLTNRFKTQRMSAGPRAPEGPGGCAPHLRPSCSAATQLYLHLNREAPSREIAGAVELDFLVFPFTQRSEEWGGYQGCFLLVLSPFQACHNQSVSTGSMLCNGSGFGSGGLPASHRLFQ